MSLRAFVLLGVRCDWVLVCAQAGSSREDFKQNFSKFEFPAKIGT